MHRITAELLRKFARFEITDDDLFGVTYDENGESSKPESKFAGVYDVSLDDLDAAFSAMKKDGTTVIDFYDNWFEPIEWDGDLEKHLRFYAKDKESWEYYMTYKVLFPGDEDQFKMLVKKMCSYLQEDRFEYDGTRKLADVMNIDALLRDIRHYAKNKAYRISPWEWHRSIAKEYAEKVGEPVLKENPDLIPVYKRCLQWGLKNENPPLMEALGYAYYGGGPAFGCDWVKSRDIFLKLMNMDDSKVSGQDKAFYANTLGYIYYYGRTNKGVPEYEAAYKYYAIGMCGGVYESAYKLADMYLTGKGVPGSPFSALNLVSWVYRENLKHLIKGDYRCKFADAALRMATYAQQGIGGDADSEDALKYINAANFAIAKRMESAEFFGDEKVAEAIRRKYDELMKEENIEDDGKWLFEDEATPLQEFFTGKYNHRVSLKKEKNSVKIIVGRMELPGEKAMDRVLLNYPFFKYCGLLKSVTLHAKDVRIFSARNATLVADHIEESFNEKKYECKLEFYGRGKRLARIVCCKYLFKSAEN